jgi:hypothetical protein
MKLLSTELNHFQTPFQQEINNLIKSIDEVEVDKELAEHIEAIRNGDESKIEDVIKSSELLVLKVISQFDKIAVSLEEMINCANKSLVKLAQTELNNKGKAVYLRFSAFTIKQSILKLIIKTETNSYS